MVRDLDANARLTIVTRFIGGFLQNLILLFLKTREARTALHWRMHNLSSDTASAELRDSNPSDTSSRGNVRPAPRARRASTRFACRRDRALHFGSQRPSVRRVGFWLNPSQTQFDVANGRKSDRQ